MATRLSATPPWKDVDDLGAPGAPCGTCGCGEFHRQHGGHWRCTACDPPILPEDLTGWAFCGEAIRREPLPYPPGWCRPAVVYLDQILPDPETALIGKCVGCRFTAPLTAERLCGRCAWERAT